MAKKVYLYTKAFSELGTMMEMVVMNVVILSLTKSPEWLSANLGLRVLGGFLSSMLAGVMADTYRRKTLMILSDILRALSIVILIIHPTPMTFLAVSFLTGFFASFFQVSFSAEVPQIFGEKNILQINSLISRLSAICMVVGFFAGGVITEKFGFKIVLAFDVATFILSAAVLYLTKWEESKPSHRTKLTVSEDVREVKNYLKGMPVLSLIVMTLLVATFGGSSHNVGIPLLAANLGEPSLYQGYIWGVWGIGCVLMTMMLPKLKFVKKHMHLGFFVAIILTSTCFIIFLSQSTLWLILPFAFLTGLFDASIGTLQSSIMQQTENHIRGRIFGVTHLINRLGFFFGFVTVPILLKSFSLPIMVSIMHGIVITSATTALIFTHKLQNKQKHQTPLTL